MYTIIYICGTPVNTYVYTTYQANAHIQLIITILFSDIGISFLVSLCLSAFDQIVLHGTTA